MKHTKIISFVAVTMLSLSALTGCGNETSKNSDLKTVTVWTNSTHTKDLATELVQKYNETRGKEKGIKIDYVVQGGDYQKALDIAVQTGETPDLFYPIAGIENYASKNALTAIEDMPGGSEFLSKYDKMLTKIKHIYKDKTYTVPYNLTTIGLVYNKDLFVKNGLVDEKGEAKPPKTWNEVREYAKKCTNPSNKEYGIAIPLKWGGYTDWELIRPFFSSTGTYGYDYENETFDFAPLAPALEWLKGIKEDKSFYPGAEGLDNDPARAQFSEGRIAMKLGASWDVGVLNDQFPAQINWGVAPIPTVTGDVQYKQFCSSDSFLAISSNIKDDEKEKIMDVFKFFHEDDFLVKMYEGGKLIPYDSKIIEKAAKTPDLTGWKEFAEMAEISVSEPCVPMITLEGKGLGDLVMNVWIGERDIKASLEDLTKRHNEALKKEIDKGNVDFSLYKWDKVSKFMD